MKKMEAKECFSEILPNSIIDSEASVDLKREAEESKDLTLPQLIIRLNSKASVHKLSLEEKKKAVLKAVHDSGHHKRTTISEVVNAVVDSTKVPDTAVAIKAGCWNWVTSFFKKFWTLKKDPQHTS